MPISLIYSTESMPCCPAFPLIVPCHPRHPHHLRPPQKNPMAQSEVWSEPCCLPRFNDMFLGSKKKHKQTKFTKTFGKKIPMLFEALFFLRSQHPTPFWKKTHTTPNFHRFSPLSCFHLHHRHPTPKGCQPPKRNGHVENDASNHG